MKNRALLVSWGCYYSWSKSAPECSGADADSVKTKGMSLDMARLYRITVNRSLAEGGDMFDVFYNGAQGTGGGSENHFLSAHPQKLFPPLGIYFC